MFNKTQNRTILFSKKCKKSLYKSTYKKNAFTKNKTYDVFEEDESFLWFVDNENNQFCVCKTAAHGYYYVNDYFINENISVES